MSNDFVIIFIVDTHAALEHHSYGFSIYDSKVRALMADFVLGWNASPVILKLVEKLMSEENNLRPGISFLEYSDPFSGLNCPDDECLVVAEEKQS
ncbi:hypothetical protein H2248_006971 [Termitomyces sp. 'cryptogamus']|nr:hypothetical protein H2248_006971 [Termitomyces sp. 'cryptogamus']